MNDISNKVKNLDDFESLITELVQDEVSFIETEEDAEKAYDTLSNTLKDIFWQLNMQGYKLIKQ